MVWIDYDLKENGVNGLSSKFKEAGFSVSESDSQYSVEFNGIPFMTYDKKTVVVFTANLENLKPETRDKIEVVLIALGLDKVLRKIGKSKSI